MILFSLINGSVLLLRRVRLLWWIHWLLAGWWISSWLHHHLTVSINGVGMRINRLAHGWRLSHVVLHWRLRASLMVPIVWIIMIFYLDMLLNNFFFFTILRTVFLLCFIRWCFDAVDEGADGATTAQNGNNYASYGIALIRFRLINWILIIPVATIIKVISIAIIVYQQEVSGIISASIEVIWCPIVSVEWSWGTLGSDTIVRIRVCCRVLISTVSILIIVRGSVVLVISGIARSWVTSWSRISTASTTSSSSKFSQVVLSQMVS